ncbi:MAG: HypC/HybG/HupF family hydrogenase formation chaperone [Chloroflexi bacterium]|nr:HypC/HybG/HupF family hydrogenase formation chaperone [Chloroflexota bacterium]
MCLGVPAKVVGLGENSMAEVEIGGMTRRVDLTLVPDCRIGDYVLIHVGFAIERLNEAAALETLALLRQMAEVSDEDRP